MSNQYILRLSKRIICQRNLSQTKEVPKIKLIVVSHRLPFVLQKSPQGGLMRASSPGGLVTAVGPIVTREQGIWVGWPGPQYQEGSQIPESSPEDRSPTAGMKSSNIVPVQFNQNLHDHYYNGCCNGTFWPLFHLMPDRADFSEESWKAYESANSLFAEKAIIALRKMSADIAANSLPGTDSTVPIIWLHDYHLMLAAITIRENNDMPKFKLGFFLHIPFPPWDILRIFPWLDYMLQGLLSNDLVGFHTLNYCSNFIDCCKRELDCKVDTIKLLVYYGGRIIRVVVSPIGIPYHQFEKLAKEEKSHISEPGVMFVLGVDRLDYTKGIQNRLLGFEKLLERRTDLREKVVLLQIAVPSRTDVKEYQDLKEMMDKLVGRINGHFSTHKWSPIRYIYGTVSHQVLASYYRDTDVALVTPLRDGMNLVAKEFVACQVKEPPGVLIISPFAGAAEQMQQALLCNPYEIDDIAQTLERALMMPKDERTLRMNYLRRQEAGRDVHHWMKNFLKNMTEIVSQEGERVQQELTPLSVSDIDVYLGHKVTGNKDLALLLDYDGTLSPLAQRPELATLPKSTKEIIERLASHPQIHISIISGRNVTNVMEMVGIKNITYAGNHGHEIVLTDGGRYVHPIPPHYHGASAKLFKDLQEISTDGAWVENKGVTLTYHYRETPLDRRDELLNKARVLIKKAGFRPSPAHAALEAKPFTNWGKGRASIYIVSKTFGLDWTNILNIVYVGDDETDEDAMSVLKGMAVTFRVTTGRSVKTVADHRLPTTDSVVTLLKWIEGTFFGKK